MKVTDTNIRRSMRRMFVIGYVHGRSSLANHEPAGHDAEAAFEAWFAEVGYNNVWDEHSTKETP